MSTGPAGGTPRTAVDERALPWGPLLLRLFVLLLPAQVAGTLVGGALVSNSGALRDQPWLSSVIVVVAGAAAGLAIGLLIRPTGPRLGSYVAVSAAFGAVTATLLMVLAALRLPSTSVSPPGYSYVVGVLAMVAVQTLVAWALWSVRARNR